MVNEFSGKVIFNDPMRLYLALFSLIDWENKESVQNVLAYVKIICVGNRQAIAINPPSRIIKEKFVKPIFVSPFLIFLIFFGLKMKE